MYVVSSDCSQLYGCVLVRVPGWLAGFVKSTLQTQRIFRCFETACVCVLCAEARRNKKKRKKERDEVDRSFLEAQVSISCVLLTGACCSFETRCLAEVMSALLPTLSTAY